MSETNIFNATPVNTESWALQGAVVNWGKAGEGVNGSKDYANEIPLVMNQIAVNFSIPVSVFTPLNTASGKTASRILIKGVPEGTFTVQSIFTPDVKDLKTFLEACQKTCKTQADQVNVSIRPFGTLSCTVQGSDETIKFQPGGIVFYIAGLDLRQFNFTISQQNNIAMTNMPLTFQLFGLSLDDAQFDTQENQA